MVANCQHDEYIANYIANCQHDKYIADYVAKYESIHSGKYISKHNAKNLFSFTLLI